MLIDGDFWTVDLLMLELRESSMIQNRNMKIGYKSKAFVLPVLFLEEKLNRLVCSDHR